MSSPWRPDLSTILDWLLPARCLACGKGGAYLCLKCQSQIPRSDWPEAVFNYQDPRIKKALHLLKYRSGKLIARDLAQALHHKLAQINHGPVLIVPIPASQKRARRRGYNQAGELAQHLVDLDKTGRELGENILIKVRETISQVGTRSRDERLTNLRNAFAITNSAQAKIKDKNILLIDDIITTGATISEARQVLLQAGARQVSALAVAH